MILNIFSISKSIALIFALLLAAYAIPDLATNNSTARLNSGCENLLGMSSNIHPNGPRAPQNNLQLIEQAVSNDIRNNSEVEIKISQLALKNSGNANIREFARQVIKVNQQIGEQLKLSVPAKCIDSKNMTSEDTRQSDQMHKAEARMQKLTGPQFDRMYLAQMGSYVRNDEQTGHSAYAMMDLPSISKLGLQVWNLARERSGQIAKLAAEEHYKLE